MTKKTKCILLHPASLTLALLISDPCTATEEFNDKNQPPAKTPDTVELKAMTVEGETIQDPNDPGDKSYTVTNSSTATKTDTPLMETPTSIQIVPRAVINDQKAATITDALENVSGVRAQPTLGMVNNIIVRGFTNQNIYRNGLKTNDDFPFQFDTA